MPKLRLTTQRESIFNDEVISKFELFNSLFLTLPFYKIKDTGTLLPLFFKSCEEGIKKNEKPVEIIEAFFAKYTNYTNQTDVIDLLFRFIQYIERQVVLFDAVEDASFTKLNTTDEQSRLSAVLNKNAGNKPMLQKIEKLIDELSLRLVLTAHPTQFYPGSVLAIITDLTKAIRDNDIITMNSLLHQLGKTPFFNKKSPTPVDEALNLAWFLENTFYFAAANIQAEIDQNLDEYNLETKKILELGFWPGGDRDGNPNINADTTLEVSKMLRQILFRCYYRDFRVIKRRITFRGVEENLATLQDVLYKNAFDQTCTLQDISDELRDNLNKIKETLLTEHDGLFVDLVNDLIRKIDLYGNYFASLDIRQDSRVLRNVHKYCRSNKPISSLFPADYDSLPEEEKLKIISFKEATISYSSEADALTKDTIQVIKEIKGIQKRNGEKACHRFIISNCQQASDILQLIELFLWNGWSKDSLTIDFVPLFETVNDLKGAAKIMDTLYSNPFYKAHLAKRGNMQHIMLGYSDSTKDGGYLMANWSIFNGKTSLTAISEKHNIQLAFFDGRGGPPARGGGKTHRFYASMGKEIANKNMQLTVQGQTISSQYGSVESAEFNIEQLINAGLTSGLKEKHNILLDPENKVLLDAMAEDSYKAYVDLREHPLFVSYLEKLSPLKLLSQANISSRPVKRNGGGEMKLEDLRAISFVTAWSMLKQNVPGFYGMGTALQNQEKAGNWDKVVKVYQDSDYLRTIVDNCMMSMSKSDFTITAHLANDKVFGKFWTQLHDEFELAKKMLFKLSGQESLMVNYPVDKKSIATRERIILPLVLIQHFALDKLQSQHPETEQKALEKLAVRTVFGIVNAGRNLA
ncbi:phosphoenolpyruvate carboxylase [Pedobacter sp. MW01-1-1]|uniref:phosphoenolpyruvate carboxylase n=1 Tax=Pedobacter sp. MW01-1-1 TaxID=3383027 RepID=UPI003FF0934A